MADSKSPSFRCFNPFKLERHVKNNREQLRKVFPDHLLKSETPITAASLKYLICGTCRLKMRKIRESDENNGHNRFGGRSDSNVRDIAIAATSAVESSESDLALSLVAVKRVGIKNSNTSCTSSGGLPPIKRIAEVDENCSSEKLQRIHKTVKEEISEVKDDGKKAGRHGKNYHVMRRLSSIMQCRIMEELGRRDYEQLLARGTFPRGIARAIVAVTHKQKQTEIPRVRVLQVRDFLQRNKVLILHKIRTNDITAIIDITAPGHADSLPARLPQKLSYTFRGHVAPVLTPFLNDSTRSLNLSIIPQYAEFLAERGVTGILVNGTSGEGPTMTVEERKAVAEAWVRAVKSTKQHLMLQIGGTCLPNVLELAKHAETIGVDSLLCLPELYFKPTNPKQLVEYLRLVGQAAPKTPLLYYHIPIFSNVSINMPQFLESVGDRIPSFVGIKFTSTNLEEATQAFRVNNKAFAVFLGSDQIMAGAFAQGMDSAITTTINLLPEVGIGILKASTAGDMAKARELQEKFTNAVIAITKYGGWVETMKVAMGLLTPFDVGPPRAPLTPLSTESVASMKQGLKALGYQVLR